MRKKGPYVVTTKRKKKFDYDSPDYGDESTIPSYYCYSDVETYERVYTPIKAYFPQKYKHKYI